MKLREMTKEQLVEKYKDKAYTEDGCFNIRTFQNIVYAVGMKKEYLHYHEDGSFSVYFEMCDPYGPDADGYARKEISSFYDFCIWVLKTWFPEKHKTKMREDKLKRLSKKP